MSNKELIETLESYGFHVQNMHVRRSYSDYAVFDISGYVKHEEVNELKELLMEKITNQTTAFEAIKARRIVIGSIDANGTFSASSNPATHVSPTQAREECKRLAKLNPGKLFTFMQFGGAEMVPTSTLSI